LSQLVSTETAVLSSSALTVFLIATCFILEISSLFTFCALAIVYIQPSRLVRSEITNTIKLIFTFELFSDGGYADKLLQHARGLYNFAHTYRGLFKDATEKPK